MRTQTIATRFDAQELLAPPVDTDRLAGRPDGQWSGAAEPAGSGTSGRAPDGSGSNGCRPAPCHRHRSGGGSTRRGRATGQERKSVSASVGPGSAPAARPHGGSSSGPATDAGIRRGRADNDRRGRCSADRVGVGDPVRTGGLPDGRWARLTLTITVLAATVVVVASLIAPCRPAGTRRRHGRTRRHSVVDRDGGRAGSRPPRCHRRDQAVERHGQGALPIGVVLRVPASVG